MVARWLLFHVPAADELGRVNLLLLFAGRLNLLHLGVCVVLFFFSGQLDRLQLDLYVHLLERVIFQRIGNVWDRTTSASCELSGVDGRPRLSWTA